MLAVDSGATLNVNGNVSIATPLSLAGTMAVTGPATVAMTDLRVAGGSYTMSSGQSMVVSDGDPTWSNPDGYGLRISAGGTFTMNGGLLIVNGVAGPSYLSVGDSTIGGAGSGPAYFNMSGGTVYAGLFGGEAGNFGLPGGNSIGLIVGEGQSPNSSVPSCPGIVNQSGGLMIVHGYGCFYVVRDAWWDSPGTGTYNLSGGTLNTSEDAIGQSHPAGPANNWYWSDDSKWSLIGVAGGNGTVNVSGNGYWTIADDGTFRPLSIASGDNVGDPSGPGTQGTVNITGGTVMANAGIIMGDVFAAHGANYQGSQASLTLNGGLLDVGGGGAAPSSGMIYIGTGGTLNLNSGTLQNVTEIYGNAELDISTGALIGGARTPLVKSGPGTLVVAGVNTYSAGTIITGGTLAIGAAPTAVPLQPLVHYTFNDGTIGQPATTFQDTGTANLPITASGGNGIPTVVAGKYTQAVLGTGNLQTAVPTALENVSAYTVSYWINTDGYGGGGIFTTRLGTGGVDQFYWPGNSNGLLQSEIYTTGSSWVSPNLSNLNLSGWNLITTTVGSGVWSIYIDGSLASGGSGTYSGDAVLSQGENLYLLTAPNAGFQGNLGDFRIYGSVLSQSQINSLYAGGEATITGTGAVGALPATTAVQIAAGSALDLSGLNQTIGSLSDYTLASGGTVTNSGGTLATLTVAPSGGSSTTFSGVIQDGNAQTALTINGNGTQDLAGANTFSGPTTLTAGTLQLDNAYAVQNSTVSVGTASSLTFGTGVGTVYLGGLAGTGNVALDDLGNNAVTIQVGGNNASTTYSGVLSGDGGLTKNGTGMLTLGGANTYAGQTLISNGTVQLGAAAPR